MDLNLSKIEFSSSDKKRDIIIPNKITKELAELIGIIIGDGSTGIYKGKGYIHYEIRFYGHKNEDFEYYKNNVNKLFKKLFNVNLKIRNYKSQGNTSFITIDSKAIVFFLSKILKIPTGQKSSITKIPNYIKTSSIEIKTAFMKGLADTDASLTFKKKHKDKHYYPIISLNQKSEKMIKDVDKMLKIFGFHTYTQYNIIKKDSRGFNTKSHSIYLSGKKNLENWMNLIGFNNPKHKTKYLIWKKFGFCQPYTTLIQRNKILN